MPKSKRKQKQSLQYRKPPDWEELMKAVKVQKASFAYRHELLLHNQTINYQNEYDRIRGMLEHTNLPESSKTRLATRRDSLHKLITENLYPTRY
jgi:hypothetical protein